ncbi:protein FAM234B-like [Babylonia areolata]|uniref:protein FAM234B-like n=1 Tax=Babylonia areolata TaxID=304850 RepID=UPI003FD05259
MMNDMTVQYTPLLQSAASDDESDALVSEENGKVGRPPSANWHKALQFKAFRSPKPGPKAQRDDLVMRYRKRRNRWVIIVGVVASVLLVGVMASAGFAILSHKFNAGLIHDVPSKRHGDWTIFMANITSESGVVLVDVDGDGLEDILMGAFVADTSNNNILTPGLTFKETCEKRGLEYPCISQVVALRGFDGKELWRTWMHFDLIFVNCNGIDVNGDLKPDCILSGRMSALQAVDLATGKIHWVIDAQDNIWSNHFMVLWLVCQAISIPDVDKDGIDDILVTHGGDPEKLAEDHNRESGRVIFLSGRSGQPMGRYLALPENRETYMSPVRYQTANGSEYILLGSGGETIPGDLFIISFSDLRDYIMGIKPPQLRTIYRGKKKGVMISPVLVDLTGDGNLDILMNAFEGVVALYDGETLREVWSRQVTSQYNPDMESYSVPALGRFDDDDVLDFMMMWGKGRWDVYDHAIVSVMSGRDGGVLWERQCQMVAWDSPLTLHTTGPHDLFIVRIVALPRADSTTSSAGPTTHGTRHKRHGASHASQVFKPNDSSLESFQEACDDSQRVYFEKHKSCSMDLSQWEQEVLVMDKPTCDSPQPIHTVFPKPFHYTLPVKEPGRHCHQLNPINRNLADVCVVSDIEGRTGAVADVDGDGELEFLLSEVSVTTLVEENYRVDKDRSDLYISRISLAPVLKGKAELLPAKEQPWRQFMGSSRDSVYRPPKRNQR